MLKIEHLTKTYGEKKAVDDLSLHIAPGEIYGFIGHNGAGKTTTLKSIAGILRFDEGEITIDGTSVKNDPLACKKKLAYIPDNPDLYEFMTGIKYLNFISDIFGVSADDRQARTMADFVVDKLGAKRIAILHDKGDYGLGLANYARQFIEESKKAEVVLFEGITVGQVDFSAVIQKIKRSNPDAVIFGGYHPEASKLVSQMRKKRMETTFVSDDGVKDEAFIKVAGKDAEGVYATGPTDTSKNPITIEYREKFKKSEGAEPGSFFDNGVAAALAIVNALEKAKSLEADDIAATLRAEKVETPFGPISFDEHGDPVGIGFNMFVVKDGQYITVE